MRKIRIDIKITERESSVLNRHLNDIKKYRLLTIEEEVNLARRIKQGDLKAKNMLICANVRFVVSVAKTFYSCGLSLDDLISEGNIGLIEAARKFDETKGFKFITYSVWYIHQFIHKYIVEHRALIRIPGNQRLILARINKINHKFEHMYNRSASYEELSELTSLSIQQVKDSLSNPGQIFHLDKHVNDGESLALIDILEDKNTIKPDDEINNQSDLFNLNKLLAILSDRQQAIIQHFFGINNYSRLTLDEIAAVVKLSKERTRQLKDEGIKTMRWAIKDKQNFNDYSFQPPPNAL